MTFKYQAFFLPSADIYYFNIHSNLFECYRVDTIYQKDVNSYRSKSTVWISMHNQQFMDRVLVYEAFHIWQCVALIDAHEHSLQVFTIL